MIQEDKELLFKDLCARLPYNLMVDYKGESYYVLGITHRRLLLCKPFMSYPLNECPLVKEVKPYLFPMSNMTEEQFKEKWELEHSGDMEHLSIPALDWLNKNNFDYRGLIEKGLAIDATNLNIY